jgi:hypothetical protein
MQCRFWKWIFTTTFAFALLSLANYAHARKIPKDWYLNWPYNDDQGPFKGQVGKRVTVRGWIGEATKQGYSILVDDKSHIAISIETLLVPKDGQLTETVTFTGWETARDTCSPKRPSAADRKHMEQNLLILEHKYTDN